MAIPSGLYTDLNPTSSGLFLFNVSIGSCILLTIFSGNAGLRIFEDDYLYFYRGNQGLLKYTGILERVGNTVSSICKTSEDYVITFTDKIYPSPYSTVRYQKQPLTANGWSTATTIQNLTSVDAISDDGNFYIDIPILVGNSRQNASIKIYRDDTDTPPFSDFIKSDYALSSGILSLRITDLEATI